MAKSERRSYMPLDDVYSYCRLLEESTERPQLNKLISAIHTLDAALGTTETYIDGRRWKPVLTGQAWSLVRNALFDWLITLFPGYFIIYGEDGVIPIEPGGPWPEEGFIEFVPKQARRREDCYRSSLSNLKDHTKSSLRWLFAEGKQVVEPSMFVDEGTIPEDVEEAGDFLDKLFEVCQDEAAKGKKRAHQAWWQLYWEVQSCQDKVAKQKLRKHLVDLQCVWGRPS